jgi:3'(2'), 5'-bisphosphate nucleotidase
MPSFFSKSQIKKIVLLALEAGAKAKKSFVQKEFTIQEKSDTSKVTSADIAISNFLCEELTKEFPQIPIICEEGNLREISSEIFFLIDPIDGTSSFISNNLEFSVNIALIKNKKAVFGLIYAPLFENGKMIFSDEKNQVIFCDNLKDLSVDGTASFDKLACQNLSLKIAKKNAAKIITKKEAAKTMPPKTMPPKTMPPKTMPPKTMLYIVTSFRSKYLDIKNYISKTYPDFLENFSVEKLSSAIKFFRLLEGKADIYLHFRPSMEWDTAAGQALLEFSGGKVRNLVFNQDKILTDTDLKYKKTGFYNQAFVAFLN